MIFTDLSIRRKLIVLCLLTSGVVLLLASGGFVVYDQFAYRRQMIRDLSITAEMTGYNSASALAFNDSVSAARTLQGLAIHPNLSAACIFGQDGAIFARYQRDADPVGFESPPGGFVARFDDDGDLDIFQPILSDGEIIGTLFLRSDFRGLHGRLWRFSLIAGVVLLISLLLAYCLAARLQGVISGPILELAAVATRVATEKAYGLRAVERGNDEVGRLIDGFNGMLDQIQLHDAELEGSRHELEHRVAERTKELARSISLLNATLESTSDGIVVVDLANRVTSHNSKFSALWQFPPAVLERGDAREARAHTAGQVRDSPRFLRRVSELQATPEIEAFDVVELKDGRTFERYVFPQRMGAEVVGVVIHWRDVTARQRAEETLRESEEKFRLLADNITDAFWIRSADMKAVHYISAGFEAIWGRSRENLFSQPHEWVDAIFPADRERVTAAFATLVENQPAISVEYRIVRPDDTIRWVQSRGFQVRDATGHVVRLTGVVTDITPRKEAEVALLERETELRVMAEAMPQMVWKCRADGWNVYFNQRWVDYTGLTQDESRGAGWFKPFHPEDQPRAATAWKNAVENNAEYNLECRLRDRHGGYRWFLIRAVPQRNDAGAILWWFGTCTDIDEQKQTAEVLAQKNALIRIAGRVTQTGGWAVETDTQEIFWSDEVCDLIGYPHGKTPRMADAMALYPEPWRAKIVEALGVCAQDGTPFDLEAEIDTLSGRRLWVRVCGEAERRADGSVKRLQGAFQDISARKQAEESLQLLSSAVEQARESITITDAQLDVPGPRIVFVNPAYTAMTGFSREETLGQTPRLLQGPRTDRAVLDRLRQNLTRGEEFEGEAINYRKDGTAFTLEWQIAPIRNAGGVITHFVSLQRDITERKQAEAELASTHQQLIKASRQAGMAEVATGVLHNIGNVLNSVNVSATLVMDHVRQTKAANIAKLSALFNQHKATIGDFLVKDPRGQMIPTYLANLAEELAAEHQTMLTELDHLRKNIDHIKDIVARQQTYARTSGVLETVSVPDLIEDALRMNAGSLAGHDVQIMRDYQARPVLTTDKHKLMQIIINFVRNAKTACNESGPTGKRIVIRTTADEHFVTIAVVDNGVGIPAENLVRIFAHGFTTRKTGHGFGLHSAALAAKELGGSITVLSDGPDTGATFILELPFQPEGPSQ